MRNKVTVVAFVFAAAMALTGCSWSDVTEKFIGTQAAERQIVTGGSVEVEPFDPEACITLGQYKGVEIQVTASDAEVQKEIDSLVSQHVTYKKIKTGTAAQGMDVNIDYSGKIDGKKFDGGSAEDQMIEVGNSGFISGFDEGVAGMKVGETKDLYLQFPDDYKNDASVAGKKVVFTVKLNYIAEEKKPEFNDKFVAANTEYKTVAEYKEKTKKSIEEQRKANAGVSAFSKVIENSKVVNMPVTLKEAEKKQIGTYTEKQIQAYGMDMDSYLSTVGMTKQDYESQLDAYAEDNALMLMVLEVIAARENITCTEEERQKALNETLEKAEVEEKEYRAQYANIYGDAFSFEEFLRQSVLYDKVVAFIEENAVIK